MVKKCKESEGCLAKLGREINADYIGQGRIGRFGKNLSIKVELYDSKSGNLISSFTGTSKNIEGLLSVIDSKAPDLFKKMSGVLDRKISSPSFANDMGDVGGGYLTDSRDGKKYRIVKIGAQTWMAENLNYNASGSKCYDNNSANCNKYGRLYNWETAMRVCPSGWHLPSNAEWDMLYRFVDKNYKADYSKKTGYSATAGKHLKATSGWKDNGNGEDTYRFRLCRAATATMAFSAMPATAAIGGVPASSIATSPTTGTCTAVTSTPSGTATLSLFCSVFVASRTEARGVSEANTCAAASRKASGATACCARLFLTIIPGRGGRIF